MRRNLLWKTLFIVLIVVGSVYFFVPPREKLKLGLDLKGGIHLVLQVVTEEALNGEAAQDAERIRADLIEKSIPFEQVEKGAGYSVEIAGVALDREADVEKAIAGYLSGYDKQTRTEGGKVRWTLTMRPGYVRQLQDTTVRQAYDTIERRVNALGLAEPTIQLYGSRGTDVTDQIIVELPGVEDPGRIKDIMKSTAQLELHLGDDMNRIGPYDSTAAAQGAYGGRVPPDYEVLAYVPERSTAPQATQYMVVKKTPVLTGKHLKNARRSADRFDRPAVSFFLNSEGAQIFGRVTEQNIGKPLAIVLDGKVRSAPRIDEKITDSGIIHGSFTIQEAEDLSLVLRSGALPASIKVMEERTVGPSLGLDSIRQGVVASFIGLALVMLAMLVYYKLSGINAIAALTLNLVILLGAMGYWRATLTLPGIAGIILTIGMAVDANILIFERVKEELRTGKTIRQAIDAGFARVFLTIIDTNLTTLIAAAFLFQFGTGPIRGFAVTLAVGLIANIFTAVFAAKVFFQLVLDRVPQMKQISI
ncbi:MAG: protein translocase subunit SecD [Acidobacteria bacterium]|nr:protein translocase subunit SecD [Acidobacteriota bacterium]